MNIGVRVWNILHIIHSYFNHETCMIYHNVIQETIECFYLKSRYQIMEIKTERATFIPEKPFRIENV